MCVSVSVSVRLCFINEYKYGYTQKEREFDINI